jgi:hypothetical protein
MREKDQADFDLETFVDLFDTAMSSDNPAVQRALKNLVLISAMVNAQQDANGLTRGPLRRLVEDIKALNKRMSNLESAGAYRSTYAPTITSPGTAVPTPGHWTGPGYNGGQSPYTTTLPGTFPPGTIISGGGNGGGSSTITGEYFQANAVNQIDVKVGSLLDKLEAK